MIAPPKSGDVTPPLDEFLTLYHADDNVWWRIGCGHHQNLFEAAVECVAALESTAEAMAGALERLVPVDKGHIDCDCAKCEARAALASWRGLTGGERG